MSLLNEIVHNGKSAYVSAFSSGLNDEIRFAVDEFILLDKYFFVPVPPLETALPSPPPESVPVAPDT